MSRARFRRCCCGPGRNVVYERLDLRVQRHNHYTTVHCDEIIFKTNVKLQCSKAVGDKTTFIIMVL